MMHSTATETAKGYHIFRKDLSNPKMSSDSGISEDMKKESSENAQYFSRVKHVRARNNLDKILQLPVNVGKRNKKKRKLEEGEPGSSTNFTSQEYLDKKFIQQQLREEEKLLKIAITYEKLRKEEPVFLDTEILHQKIAEYQRLRQEARNEYQMKNIMCVNLQLANTLQRIVGKTKATHKQNGFSDSQRKCIEDLLTKKKELNKRIGVRRKEIAELDEDVLKLKKTVLTNKQKRSKQMDDFGASTKTDNFEELERLEENNEKVADRVHLLSRIIQSLISHIGSGCQQESELLNMMEECEKVSKCHFDDLAAINAVLTSVCSVNL